MARGLEGRVAVVTGGVNGIGRAFCRRLAQDGADVAILDLEDGTDAVAELETFGRSAFATRCDVSSPEQVAAAAKEVEAQLSPVDILVLDDT